MADLSPQGVQPQTAAAKRLKGWLGLNQRQWENVLETIGAIIRSLAALSTSWSGYQAGALRCYY